MTGPTPTENLPTSFPMSPATDRPGALTTPELETELLGLAGHLAAAQCRFLQLLAEFDRRAGWAGPGLRSCAHWLCWRIGMSLRTATEHVRVAHALAELPAITAAFAQGRISYSKVRAITRITGQNSGVGPLPVANPAEQPTGAPAPAAAPETRPSDHDGDRAPTGGTAPPEDSAPAEDTAAPGDTAAAPGDTAAPEDADAHPAGDTGIVPGIAADAEETLLALALAGTASHVETVVRAARRRRTDPARAAAERSLSWRWAEDGSLLLRGRFSPADGAALIAAVESLVPPRRPVRHPVPPAPADWERRAAEQEPGAVADRTGARRADALLALTLGTAPTSGATGAPTVARGQAQVVVVIDADAGTAAVEGGPEIPAPTAERLACDGRARVLLRDTGGDPLHLGRRRRLASPAQIAALTVRDAGRCRFPGCTHTRHLHAHHVRHWLHGGRSDVGNLVLLCSFHHALVHDRGYGIHREDGSWVFRRPDGSEVPEAGPPLDGNVESLIEIAARAGLRVDRDGLTPSWAGERLDPEPILDRLLPRPPGRPVPAVA